MINRSSYTVMMINRCTVMRSTQKGAAKNSFCLLRSPWFNYICRVLALIERMNIRVASYRESPLTLIASLYLSFHPHPRGLSRYRMVRDPKALCFAAHDYAVQVIIASRCAFVFNTGETMSRRLKKFNGRNRATKLVPWTLRWLLYLSTY